MRILILDDERYRHDAFERRFASEETWHAYTLKQFMNRFISQPKFNTIYLDHDIADSKAETGLDAVRFLVDTLKERPDKTPDKIIVHSWNPVGAKAMFEALRLAGLNVTLSTFSTKNGIYTEV